MNENKIIKLTIDGRECEAQRSNITGEIVVTAPFFSYKSHQEKAGWFGRAERAAIKAGL